MNHEKSAPAEPEPMSGLDALYAHDLAELTDLLTGLNGVTDLPVDAAIFDLRRLDAAGVKQNLAAQARFCDMLFVDMVTHSATHQMDERYFGLAMRATTQFRQALTVQQAEEKINARKRTEHLNRKRTEKIKKATKRTEQVS